MSDHEKMMARLGAKCDQGRAQLRDGIVWLMKTDREFMWDLVGYICGEFARTQHGETDLDKMVSLAMGCAKAHLAETLLENASEIERGDHE